MDLVYLENPPQLTDNLVPKVYNFNEPYTYSVTGTGLAENQLGYSYSGAGCLRVENTDYQNTDLVATLYSTPVALEDSGVYHFSFFLQNGIFEPSDLIVVQIFKGVALFQTLEIYPYDANVPSSVTNWKRYGQVFTNSGGLNNYTFKVTLKANASSIYTDKSIYIDGFKVELNDKGLIFPAAYTEAKEFIFETTQTINVPSIANNTTYTVVGTLTGAIVGDYVEIVPPVALITLGLIIGFPVVTNTNEVSFTLTNLTGGAVDPASAGFKFKIKR